MHLIPCVLDRRIRISNGSVHEIPLLTLPFGMGSMIDYLAGQFESLDCGKPLVVSMLPQDQGHARKVRMGTSTAIDVLDREEFERRVRGSETSDFLLLIDPSHWPIRGYNFQKLIDKARGFRGATHVIAIGDDPEQICEHVECDADGRVSKVRRVFRRMTWPEVPVAPVLLSIVPMQALADVGFGDLANLRTRLAARGLLTQDVPLRSETVNLSSEAGWLALGERLLRVGAHAAVSDGRPGAADGIVLGEGCSVHPSARLRGRVVVQDGAVIEANAAVIGPSIIGASSHVGRGAVVAQAILAWGANVEAGGRVNHCVVPGNGKLPERPPARGVVPGAAGERRRRFGRADSGMTPPGTLAEKWPHFAAKRVLDVVCAVLGLVVLSPLLIAVAVLVKLTSPGPVFFAHRREQVGGREFPCLKFRTMVADAHRRQREMYAQNNVDGPQFKIEGDPRLTRVGDWLRMTNMDELPQLLNVVAGQMSLVGPRPSPFRENQICVPWRRARLSVRPGITGLWQICRDRRSEGDFHQWIYYDLAYVRHFSIWLDLKILFYTMLTKGGRRMVPVSRLIRSAETHDEAHAASASTKMPAVELAVSS